MVLETQMLLYVPPRAPAYVQVPYPVDCSPVGGGGDVPMGGCPPEVPSLGWWKGKRSNIQLQSVYLFERGWWLHLSWAVERLSSPADAKPHTGLCFPIPQKPDRPALQCGKGGSFWGYHD